MKTQSTWVELREAQWMNALMMRRKKHFQAIFSLQMSAKETDFGLVPHTYLVLLILIKELTSKYIELIPVKTA